MKSTGIVRKIDLLGRIVVPKETRQKLSIEEGDPIEFFYDEGAIYLKKYSRGCLFCDSMENVSSYNGQYVCNSCRNDLVQHSNNEYK